LAVQNSAKEALKTTSTGSPQMLSRASNWLSRCILEHEHCARVQGPCQYPARLLKISNRTVKVIVTSEHDTKGPYATLSHCWGEIPPRRKLTPDNCHVFASGVDVFDLESTYRNALLTVRSMGIQYLWIDLFCILQGDDAKSKADWASESQKMDSVYSEGCLNISAACAPDGSAGCFTKPTEPVSKIPLLVYWRPLVTSQAEWIRTDRFRGRDRRFIEFYMHAPVFKLGWIVQECVLAPRVLYFADGGLIWQCGEYTAADSCPQGLGADMPGLQELGPGSLTSWRPAHSLDLWYRVWESYSATMLSRPNIDKLVAILRNEQTCRQSYWRLAILWISRFLDAIQPLLEHSRLLRPYFPQSNQRDISLLAFRPTKPTGPARRRAAYRRARNLHTA
jgi:hypothetical protein